jgi:hypothetical protein
LVQNRKTGPKELLGTEEEVKVNNSQYPKYWHKESKRKSLELKKDTDYATFIESIANQQDKFKQG